jgi:hypothetical protein
VQTECNENEAQEKLCFSPVGRRRVEADFTAGQVSSDGGSLVLREADLVLGLSQRLAACFEDCRNPDLIEHSVAERADRAAGLRTCAWLRGPQRPRQPQR